MPDEVTRSNQNALNKIVNTTDQSGNMRKELKKIIYKAVSTLRNVFIKMKVMLEEGTKQKNQTEKEINATKIELEACRRANTKGKIGTPSDRERELPKTVSTQVLPPHDHLHKICSEAVVGREERKFKLTLRSKDSQNRDEIKRPLKSKVNPTELKV